MYTVDFSIEKLDTGFRLHETLSRMYLNREEDNLPSTRTRNV